ncbi:4Fe-4S ferredoxin N-terminal domain-containing protein [Halobiforma nitratireducens]|uniref:4Fe-4S ferredoxin n=1 Tax=Halobiforma nitratireducens JCM 10879 TaxID=1227454 RepID=M0LZX5_9EURY|nr:4Fe-4S ferredoxin N-terminal domain-containing protein [Halobiforma nitratireducens]EMA38728.1 4Fe-4S ferredoxin [Halobiforma nitratireducens JCM 10879]
MSTDDESFHPLGSEWEDELETMLDDTEYDTELGMQMAQDAFRVSKGELSEAEFHEKYHDDVMEEFGEDERPTKEAYQKMQAEASEEGTVSRMLSKFEGDGEESRRDAMKKMGAGAAAVGLGAWGTVDDGPEEPPQPSAGDTAAQADEDEDDGVQWGMAIDLDRCDGCLTCVSGCASENQLDSGVNWMYVLQYDDPSATGEGSELARPAGAAANRLVRPCQHCTDAPCEKVCPTTARHTRDKDGLVLTDYDVCIGCRYCQVACPYGVNYFQWDEPDVPADAIKEHYEEEGMGDHMTDDRGRWVDSRAPRGVMSKCTMCPTRQDGQMGEGQVGTTACEEACPTGAIQFGDMNDPESDPQKYEDNPARGRTLWRVNPPSADELEEDLDGVDDDLESVLEATDLEEDELTLIKAVDIVSDGLYDGDEELHSHDLDYHERNFREALDALADHGLDHDSEEVLVGLGLADETDEDEEFDGPDERDAQMELEAFTGSPDSNFRLLEEYDTNPNVIYMGQQPGPNAEQTEPTGTGARYEQLSYDTVTDGEIQIVDNRKDVLDEDTVGGGLFS